MNAMCRISDIKAQVEKLTGVAVSVSIGRLGSSMRGYVIIRAKRKGGQNVEWSFENSIELTTMFIGLPETPTTCNKYELCVFVGNEAYNYSAPKTERAKTISPQREKSEQKKSKGWGSKNSQMRLDKASRRFAKRMKRGNTVRYL